MQIMFLDGHIKYVLLSLSLFGYLFSVLSITSSFLFQTIEALSSVPAPELSLRLYLQCAEVHRIVCFLFFEGFLDYDIC